ncbi:hypothetical protein CKAH01_09590 [Colletotrichum kahawae]|uniref:Uncharacterized protein n=1 Tax=Colletotrichum kahawae TaxID=34407 RepID=A0AAD9XZM5_COLKA|nr:hypothetical protein CKAH01_09590 [Colletotrichum kahawae]
MGVSFVVGRNPTEAHRYLGFPFERATSFHKWNLKLLPLSNPCSVEETASPCGYLPTLLTQASLLPSSTVPTQRKLHSQFFTFYGCALPFCSQASPPRSLARSCSRPEAYLPCLHTTQLASKHRSAPAQEPSTNFVSMKRNSSRTNVHIGLRHRRHPNFRERHSLSAAICRGALVGAHGCSDVPTGRARGTWELL